MRRALIGFSSPIGYDYRYNATETKNDRDLKPPNARLFGATGLLLLYDEIVFACESLCPENMRGLSYVRYLDREFSSLGLSEQRFRAKIDAVYQNYQSDIKFQIAGLASQSHQDFCDAHFGKTFDDHRNVLIFCGEGIFPKCGTFQTIIDTWIINHFRNLNLTIVINPFTMRDYFRDLLGVTDVEAGLKKLEISEKLISLQNIMDIDNEVGPYHPVIEELRHDSLIENYRKWLSDDKQKWHNREIKDIVNEVDAKVYEFTLKSLAAYVAPTSLIQTTVSVTKGLALDAIPLGSTMNVIGDEAKRHHQRQEFGWQAFIARSRFKVRSIT